MMMTAGLRATDAAEASAGKEIGAPRPWRQEQEGAFNPTGLSLSVIGVFLLCTVVKVGLAAVWGWTRDIPQTFDQAEAFLAGRHYFSPLNTGHIQAIFPLGYYFLASGALLLAEQTGLPFALWIKVPAILADLLIVCLLSTTPRAGRRAAFIYLLNPISFLLSVYHGQLHTVAIAGAVLALWCADRGYGWAAGLALGLGASVRQYVAILVVPLLLRTAKQRRALLFSFVATLVLANATLMGSYEGRLAQPVWVYGAWGYGMLCLQLPRVLALWGVHVDGQWLEEVNRSLQSFGSLVYWTWAVVFVVWVWNRFRSTVDRRDVWSASLLLFIGHYAISPGFGVQWLIWALPFWLVVDVRGAVGYSLLAGTFLAGSYWQWGLPTKYGVASVTANLSMLGRVDLVGLVLVGAVGTLTWLYCLRASWRLARAA